MAKEKANPQAEEQKQKESCEQFRKTLTSIEEFTDALKTAEEKFKVLLTSPDDLGVMIATMALDSFYRSNIEKAVLVIERTPSYQKHKATFEAAKAAKAAAENENKE